MPTGASMFKSEGDQKALLLIMSMQDFKDGRTSVCECTLTCVRSYLARVTSAPASETSVRVYKPNDGALQQESTSFSCTATHTVK